MVSEPTEVDLVRNPSASSRRFDSRFGRCEWMDEVRFQ
jgi:hypothetical protein